MTIHAVSDLSSAPRPSRARWLRRVRRVAPIAGAAIFIASLVIIFRELRNFQYHQVTAYLSSLGPADVGLAILFTAASGLALASYDVLATRDARKPVPLRRLLFASFVSSSVSNTVGLSGVAGGSLRYRLYTAWGLDAAAVARVIVFGAVTFWLGFLTLGGIVLSVDPLVLPPWAGPLLILLPAAYLVLVLVRHEQPIIVRGRPFLLPRRGIAAGQLLVSVCDWLFAAAVFFVLLPPHRVSFLNAVAVFLAAQLLGVSSNLPGGIGVFEAAVFSLLSSTFAPTELAGTLIAFRAIYYLLPLIAAVVLLAAEGVLRKRAELMRVGRGVAETVSLFAPAVFSAAIFLCGAVLLFSGATPAERVRVHVLRQIVPLPFVEIAHLAGSVAGIGLLLLARGIQRRLNGAYVLSVALLCVGIAASLMKGLDYEEASLLAITLVAFVACRREFYRTTALIDEPFTLGWTAAIGLAVVSATWLGFFAYRRIEYAPQLWWHFSFAGDAPRFLRASLAVAGVVLAFSFRKLLRAAPAQPRRATEQEMQEAARIAHEKDSPNGHLVLLRDKSILWNEGHTAFLMYGVQGRSWVAMGDPVGDDEDARELAWRFYEEADRHDAWPVFYQVRTSLLPLYVEIGLRLFKLGEEARVDCLAFSLTGSNRKGLRHTVRKLEAAGATMEVVQPDAVPPLLPELRRISDEWLAAKSTREKRFSIGFFDEAYLCELPLAIVRVEGVPVAFANLWKDAAGDELTIDLMRHSDAAPPGVMDFLFVRLFEHARELGCRWFNLGIAPLAGVEARTRGPLWGRIAALGVEHGGRFYNFEGLRQYKDKFDPVWQPVFLASPGGMRFPVILRDVAALISGGVRGILLR